jgi:hypothetical protein
MIAEEIAAWAAERNAITPLPIGASQPRTLASSSKAYTLQYE